MLEDVILKAVGIVGVGGVVYEAVRAYRHAYRERYPTKPPHSIIYRRDRDRPETSENGVPETDDRYANMR